MLAAILPAAKAIARALRDCDMGALVNSGSKLEVSVSEERVGLNGGMTFLCRRRFQSMSAKKGWDLSSLAS